MKGSEVKLIREASRLSQETFAHILGVDRSTVTRWELGTLAVPTPAAKLIRAYVRLGELAPAEPAPQEKTA